MPAPAKVAYGQHMPRYRALATLATAALAGAVLATTSGCVIRWNTLEDGLRQTGAVTEVHISGGAGDVTVIGDDTVGVDARRRVRYAGAAPGQTMSVSGSVLSLQTSCGNMCGVSYQVHVGRGVKVTGSNSSGNLTLRGVSDVDVTVTSGNIRVETATGAVTVHSTSGDVDLLDIDGDVDASVTSGNIDATNLRGAQATVNATSGDITLTLPGTGDVTARASSGDINVRLPDRCCRVSASASSGDAHIEVGTDQQSSHLVDLHTGSGDITVRAA